MSFSDFDLFFSIARKWDRERRQQKAGLKIEDKQQMGRIQKRGTTAAAVASSFFPVSCSLRLVTVPPAGTEAGRWENDCSLPRSCDDFGCSLPASMI